MDPTTITSKGQVTIPKAVRQRLGIRQDSRIEFKVLGDHVEMHRQSAISPRSGFGMLKSSRPPVPADLDPDSLPATDGDE